MDAYHDSNADVQFSSRMSVRWVLKEQLAAAKAGDEDAVQVLHEAVGRLIGG